MIPEEARAEAHLRIGRLLATHTAPEQREEAIFEIVNQLNRGRHLIASQDEREQLAELNLIAGQRAKSSTAYASALKYLTAGAALLAEDCWDRRHDLVFALELLRAEFEFLTGELAAAEKRLAALSMRAGNTVERAAVACLRMDLYTTLGSERPRGRGRSGLPPDIWASNGRRIRQKRKHDENTTGSGRGSASREIEDLIDLPLMSDPASLATFDVLTRLVPPAIFTDMNLLSLIMHAERSISASSVATATLPAAPIFSLA